MIAYVCTHCEFASLSQRWSRGSVDMGHNGPESELAGHKLHEMSPSMYHAQSHHLLLHNIRLQRVSTDFACSFAKGFLITKTSRRTQSWRDLAQIFYWEIWGAQTTLAQSSCTSPGPVHPSQVSQDLYLSRIIRDHSWSRSDFGSSCDPDVLWSIDSLPLSIGGLHNQGHRPPNFQKGTKETMIIALLL